MLLTIKKSSVTNFTTQFNDYVNNLLAITAYHHAIENLIWPTLQFQSADGTDSYKNARTKYNDYISNQAVDLRTHAQEWINSVLPLLMSSPTVISYFNNIFESEIDSINSSLEALIADPTDKLEKQQLVNVLSALQKSLDQKEKVFTNKDENNPGIIEVLTNFYNTFSNDINLLNAGVVAINNMTGADKTMLTTLNESISTVDKEIDNLNSQITANAIGIGGSVFVTVIAVAFLPESALFVLGGFAGVAAFAVMLAKDKAQLLADTGKLKILHDQATQINKDIINLNTISAVVSTVESKYQTALKALTETQSMWNDINNELIEIIDTINASMTKVGSADPDYATIQSNIVAANTEWNTLVQQLNLIINLNINYEQKVQLLNPN